MTSISANVPSTTSKKTRKPRASKKIAVTAMIESAQAIAAQNAPSIEQVLASIDQAAETSISVSEVTDAIDHDSQLMSWSFIDSDDVIAGIDEGASETELFADTSYNEPDRDEPEHDIGEQSRPDMQVSADLSAQGEPQIDETTLPATTTAESEESPSASFPGASLEDAELDRVIGAIELQEGISAPAEIASDNRSFDQILKEITEDDAKVMAFKVAQQIDIRAAYETEKNPENLTIQKTLTKVRSQLVSLRAARVLIATNVDPMFINRQVHTGSSYNVYALGKLADFVFGVSSGAVTNAINLACTRSLFALRKAGMEFNGETAKACASKNYRIDAAIRRHLISHTVSPSTAPTQASSTMQALVTLGLVKAEGSVKNPIYKTTDNAIVAKMEGLLAA